MEKHIYDEKNGLSYTLCGDYYLPDLVLNEEEPIYGKYGMLETVSEGTQISKISIFVVDWKADGTPESN